MQNHPHDSICSCSCDEIYEEMKTRFAKSVACTEALRDGSLDYLAATIDTSETNGDRAIVVLSLEPNHSVVTVHANVDFDKTDDVSEIAIFDENGNPVAAKIKLIRNCFTYTLPDDRFRQPKYVNRFEVEMQVESRGIGYRTFAVRKQTASVKTAVRYTDRTAENDWIAVKFNDNGTIDVTNKKTGRVFREQNLFEDTKDQGNLYNYAQPAGDVAATSRNAKAEISLFEVTPFSVTFKAVVPLAIDADITTYVTVSDKIARVDIRTVVTNRAENHRLRALFSTDIEATTVLAEGQFDLVRRTVVPAPTWKNPCNAQRDQAFVTIEADKGGDALMIANRGLCEYEALRDGHNTLAIALLRCVGQIGDWGVFPTPLGQCKGTYTLEYSIVPYSTEERAAAYGLGYVYAGGATVAIGTDIHGGSMANATDYVSFDNEFIRMSAFKKAEDSDATILRLFNISEQPQHVCIRLGEMFRHAAQTDMAERTVGQMSIENGNLELDVPAKKILTFSLS